MGTFRDNLRPESQSSNLELTIFRLFGSLLILLAFSAAAEPGTAPPDDFNAQSAAATTALQQWYNQKTGLWDTTGWWNAAHCVEALEDSIAANHSVEYLPVLDHTFERNARGKFLNEYYDDEGWWVNSWIRAYDLTGQARFLAMAKTIFQNMTGGWDDHCGGGIWWRKDRRYKNAIANELFFLDAVRLHQRTPGDAGPQSYFDWAAKEWHWFEASGLINPRSLVNDGLDADCQNNGRTTWSYNQGVLMGALAEWHKVTGDPHCLEQATAIADAVLAALVNTNGILREPREPRTAGNHDVPQFKGIFIRQLAALYDFTHKPAYQAFLLANARSIWANDRNDRDQLGFRWAGPFDIADAARQSSALAALCAVASPITEVARGGPNIQVASGLMHDLGRPDAFNNWQADPLRDKASGFLCKGGVALSRGGGGASQTLKPGRYVAEFELKVDNFNLDNSHVATLSVADAENGTVIASRDLTRDRFTTILYHSFPLTFRAAPGHRYEFRVFWHYSPNAPRLTQRSLLVRLL